MIEDNYFSYNKFYDSYNEPSIDNKSEILNTNIESIINDYNFNHYYCDKCYKYPFIKFSKDRKNVRLTCSCLNNKKITIEELFKIIDIRNSEANFLTESSLNINIENQLKCKEHNKKFKGSSKIFLYNYCEDCYEYRNGLYYNDIIIFDEIKIEEKKIEEIIEKIYDNKDLSEEISEETSNYTRYIKINENTYEKLSKEEDKRYKILINIIIYIIKIIQVLHTILV